MQRKGTRAVLWLSPTTCMWDAPDATCTLCCTAQPFAVAVWVTRPLVVGLQAAHQLVLGCFIMLCGAACVGAADGQVLVDGYDLTELDAQWYRSKLGVVSQEPRLFSCSVRDNICYGCPFM